MPKDADKIEWPTEWEQAEMEDDYRRQQAEDEHARGVWYHAGSPSARHRQGEGSAEAEQEAAEATQTEKEEFDHIVATAAHRQVAEMTTQGAEPTIEEDSLIPHEAKEAGLSPTQWQEASDLVDNGGFNIFGAIQSVAGRKKAAAYSQAVNKSRKEAKERAEKEERDRDPDLPKFENKQARAEFEAEQARLAIEYRQYLNENRSADLESFLATQPDSPALRYFRTKAGLDLSRHL